MSCILQEHRPLILTIDDDDMIRLLLDDILSREGFEVVGATGGQVGLEMFRERRPSLILLDVMMPEMDGFACLEALRALSGTSLLPIIMLTGADDVASIHRSFGLGATDFIAKPINWSTLPYRLRYMLRASQALTDLAYSESVLRNAQKIARLGNWEFEPNTEYVTCSNEALHVLGVAPENFNNHWLALLKAVHVADTHRLRQVMTSCLNQGHSLSIEIRVVHTDNTVFVVHIQGEAEVQHGMVVRLHGTVQDITERRKIEDQVRFLSYYDPLTGLPNRALFKEILEQAISYCDRYGTSLATLFVRIDRFKRINETLGPLVGDRVLQLFANCLSQSLRDSDYVAVATDFSCTETTVSRLGGSEFTIMLNPINSTQDSIKVAKRIFQGIATPFEVDGHEIYLKASIGIAVYPGDSMDVNTFIKNGEFAMHHAGEQGQNTYQFFSKSLNVAAFQKLSLESNLRRAIERNELILHYQPKINLQHNRVIGMEVLVRWQRPNFGLIPPTEFIPVAEDSGLIIPISNWILKTACCQVRAWQLDGLPPLSVAVNISALQFRQTNFLLQVHETLEISGLAAENLKLELTEGILLDNIDEVMTTLNKLRAMGIQISIDDFGTGYSSLAYLKKLPISELKIDQSFVRDIPHSEDDMTIVSTIIAMAKALSLAVVAEGVETEQQVDFLRQQGCDMVQGYFYSKPLPSEEFAQFVLNYQQGNA